MIHKNFIENILVPAIEKKGILYVGNHLNEYFTFKKAEKYANEFKKRGTDRVQKSSKDAIMGRLVEEMICYLLVEYFKHNNLNYGIINDSKGTDFKLVHEKMGYEKTFDVDIIIHNKENDQEEKYYLLSCKGTVRERIGQYISNLFLMDDRLIKTKYNDRYYLDFRKNNKVIKYGMVCLDWADGKDFVKYTPKGNIRKTLKQTEVYLISDDMYIGGGMTVLNNLDNLDRVMNFGELVGKITAFLK